MITSPTRDSYTISSSNSPTLRGPVPDSPSGSTTVYMPRSGMVPPLVTARRCAPGRAEMRPASSLYCNGGRNAENSSLLYAPVIMPITESNMSLSRSRKGAALRTCAYHSSGSRSSIAAAATVCWASTSSGLPGMCSGSRSPAVMLLTLAATPMICLRVTG